MKHRKSRSLFRLIAVQYISGVILLSIIMLIGMGVIVMQLRNNYIDSKIEFINWNIERMEDVLSYMEQELNTQASEVYAEWLEADYSSIPGALLKQNLYEGMYDKVQKNNEMDCMFVSGEDFQLRRYHSSVSSGRMIEIMTWLEEQKEGELLKNQKQWSVVVIEDRSYLLRTVMAGPIIVGILSSMEHYEQLMAMEFDGAKDGFAIWKGEAIQYAYNWEQTDGEPGLWKVMIEEPISDTGFVLKGRLNISFVTQVARNVVFILVGIALVVFVFLGTMMQVFRRRIHNPIKQLILGTGEAARGNLEVRVPVEQKGGELTELEESFNHMIREIKDLRIVKYEQQIEAQKRELRMRNLQLRPHFYLNAMTSIKGMTYQGDNERIRDFLDALSGYMRYMMNISEETVTLQKELDNLEYYLRVQEIKAAGSVMTYMDIDETCRDAVIPCFAVYTLVENAFKHAMNLYEPLLLLIKCERKNTAEFSGCLITVEDNGRGYSEEVLRLYNESSVFEEENQMHIGLTNLRKTLELLYHQDNLMRLSNAVPHGAHTEIWIPVKEI